MDDIIFWETGNTYESAIEKLQEKAKGVELWLNEHQMRLNESKSKLIANKEPLKSFGISLQGCTYFPVKKIR